MAAPDEGDGDDEGDDREKVVCMASPDAPDEGDGPPEDALAFEAPLGLEERWREEIGGSPAIEFAPLWRALKGFLVLASRSDTPVRPTAEVDVLWHEFILFTRDYFAFCNLLGGYIHHVPEFATAD